MPRQVGINWHFFSLAQVNHPDADTWKVWEQPSKNQDWQEERYAASLSAFWSAEAARRQGPDAFDRFHLALLRERHQHGNPLNDLETLRAAAGNAGLDMVRFEEALADAGYRGWDLTTHQRLASDHARAISLGVFGTPTLVFPGAEPVYLKLKRVPSAEESLDFWEVFRSTAVDRPYVLEMKRPH